MWKYKGVPYVFHLFHSNSWGYGCLWKISIWIWNNNSWRFQSHISNGSHANTCTHRTKIILNIHLVWKKLLSFIDQLNTINRRIRLFSYQTSYDRIRIRQLRIFLTLWQRRCITVISSRFTSTLTLADPANSPEILLESATHWFDTTYIPTRHTRPQITARKKNFNPDIASLISFFYNGSELRNSTAPGIVSGKAGEFSRVRLRP